MAADSATPRRPQFRPTLLLCVILLAIFAAMSYSAILQKSPTFDEPEHVVGGYLIRWLGDYRVDTEDPALFGWLTTLPQKESDLGVDKSDPMLTDLILDRFKQLPYAVQIMFRTPQTKPDEMGQVTVYAGGAYINRSRVVFTIIGVLLGGLIAWWSYQLAGAKAALIATLLFTFDPNFLAHSSIVKNDVPLALLMLGAMYSVWRFGKRMSWLSLFGIAAACALAVNIKFSGVLFGIFVPVALLGRAALPLDWPIPGNKLAGKWRRAIIVLAVCIFSFLLSWAAIWTVYRFRYSMTPDPSVHFNRAELLQIIAGREATLNGQTVDSQMPLDAMPSFVRLLVWVDDHHLLPEAWTNGFLFTYQSTLQRGTYLLGNISDVGKWYYFPCAMLFKTPLAVLILVAILLARGVWRTIRRREQSADQWNDRWAMICLWIPIVIYGFSAMRSNLAIGVRHVLPIYPFIYILMATALARWIEMRGRAIVVLASVLVIGLASESVLAWPDYIPFFNIACGGTRGGIRLLGDSNLDWGQDLPILADWAKEHPNTRLYLVYFGLADPAYYGINYTNVAGGYIYSPLQIERMDKPGVIAISASDLQGIYFTGSTRNWMQAFQKRKPLDVLGGSIYLYEWTPADAAAAREQSHPTSQP
ncbi:MAG TPA: phospholipid carrier-dependent glycosyltransferase [Tepidisphaeraceae bacterium]|jgi:4-amino-4-deoxy-L-arabinose transferase-like glycosyltransferase|nr:phospholipid carrier-dependent glycosyltransferase [Tepidisphaeraceae bacterium]